MAKTLPHAVVLGLSPTGLYAARELGGANVPLLGVASEFSCGSVSRYFMRLSGGSGVWHEPDLERLLGRLIAFSESMPYKPLLFPTSDYYIDFLISNYSRLKPHFQMSDSYGGLANELLDKAMFHKLCVEHGLETPNVLSVSKLDDLECRAGEIKFPCILKPAYIHLAKPYMQGRKVIVLNTLDELELVKGKIPSSAGGWLVQEIIPGRESRLILVAGYCGIRKGEHDLFTARKLRQFPPGFGSASSVISETFDEAKIITSQFIEKMGYKGVYGSEFKLDPRDGRLKIIEINPRPTLWFHVSHVAGKRLMQRAYCDLAGLPAPDDTSQRNGVLWTYKLKDLASSLQYKLRAKNLVFPPPNLLEGGRASKHCWPVFSISDPFPVLVEVIGYIVKLISRKF